MTAKKPKIICIWNGHRLPEMAIKAAANGLDIKIAYFENGLLPNTTVMDFRGVNAYSSIPRDEEFYVEYAKTHDISDDYKNPLLERKAHKKRKGLTFEKFDFECDYIFVPFQVNFDSQVVINSPNVNSMSQLYEVILEVVDKINDKKLIFVVKEHPSDAKSYTNLHHMHERIKFVDENTEKLIKSAKAIITLNSSVGIEAAMMGKNVIVLGDACYGIDGVTSVVSTKNQLVEEIDKLNIVRPNEALVKSFFNYLKKEYLLPVAWQNCTKDVAKNHVNKFDKKISKELV